MTFISLPNVGSLTLDVSNVVSGNYLAQRMANDLAMRALRGYVKRSRNRKGLSRRIVRKNANRKRRRFVDNIIMHHKRLHDRNRAIAVSNARSRALAKREAIKKHSQSHTPEAIRREREESYHNSSTSFRERANSLRGRVDARRLRARSRWLSSMGETVDN